MGKTRLVLAAFAAICTAAPAAASTVVVDQWYAFNFGGVGSTFIAGLNGGPGTDPASVNAGDADWTFTLLTAGSITFVDGFLSGDQFTITDFGSAIGSTSLPTVGTTCTNDITACLNNASISQGTFALAAGSHSINGSVIATPPAPNNTGGGGFFRINSIAAVPELSTWAMMLFGFGGIGLAVRRRRRAQLAQPA